MSDLRRDPLRSPHLANGSPAARPPRFAPDPAMSVPPFRSADDEPPHLTMRRRGWEFEGCTRPLLPEPHIPAAVAQARREGRQVVLVLDPARLGEPVWGVYSYAPPAPITPAEVDRQLDAMREADGPADEDEPTVAYPPATLPRRRPTFRARVVAWLRARVGRA